MLGVLPKSHGVELSRLESYLVLTVFRITGLLFPGFNKVIYDVHLVKNCWAPSSQATWFNLHSWILLRHYGCLNLYLGMKHCGTYINHDVAGYLKVYLVSPHLLFMAYEMRCVSVSMILCIAIVSFKNDFSLPWCK